MEVQKNKNLPKALTPSSIKTPGGFKLLSILGIDIYINYTWFLVVVLIAWSLASGYFPQQLPGKSLFLYWGMGFITSIVFFLCILVHELSHSYVSKKSGIPVPRITLFVFGGVAHISREPESPSVEFKIAIAGPFTSAILWGMFFLLEFITATFYKSLLLQAFFGILALVNGAVTLFNLVPGFPLDGGRLLRAYLWKKTGNFNKATFLTSQVGKIFAVFLIFLGFFQMILGQIIGGIWLIFIGFFLEQAAATSYQQTLIKESLTGAKVKEIMTPKPISVDYSTSLTQLVENFFFKHRFASYPVVKDGKFAGCVTLNHVKNFPREKWSKIKVSEVMDTFPPQLILHPEDEVVDALSKMIKSGKGRLPVVDKGELVGILTRKDIMSFLKIRTDLGIHKEKEEVI